MSQSYTRNQPLDNDVTLAADSPYIAATQHAVKTYVDSRASGNVWPLSNKINIDSTEYTSIAAAILAMLSGQELIIGVGSFVCDDQSIVLTEAFISGSGINETFLTSTANNSTASLTWTINTRMTFQNFSITRSATSSTPRGISAGGNGTHYYLNLKIAVSNTSGAGTITAFEIGDNGQIAHLIDCQATASGAGTNQALHLQVSGATAYLHGGYYAGNVLVDSGATLYLYGPTITGTFTNNGTAKGWYFDSNGLIHLIGSGGTSQYVKQTSANGALSVGTIASADLPSATETAVGGAEIATQTETDTGTDDARIVTPLKLKTTPIDHLKVSKIYESDAGAAALSADATGYLSAAVQPLFSAYVNTTLTDVTGDGTVYQVVFNTEIFDRNSNYNNSTGIFTAPVTGMYLIVASLRVTGLTSSHTNGYIRCTTSNRQIYANQQNLFALSTGGATMLLLVAIADMDVSDTASIYCYVDNGTKVVDIYGSSSYYSYFSAYLLP